MMVIINDLKWSSADFKRLNMLCTYFSTKSKDLLSLKVNVKVVDNSIVFDDVEPNKTMLSIKSNKIYMRQGDPRIKKLGREYLDTKRPTKKQYYGFFEMLNATLNSLNLNGTINYKVKDKTYVIRNGKEIVNEFPEIPSFPKEA